MTESKLQIHPAVESDDLVGITAYIARDDPEAAQRVLTAILGTFGELAAQPGLGTTFHPARKELQGVRMLPVPGYPSYLVYYRPLPQGIGMRILHVLHAARDTSPLRGQARR